MKHVFVYNILRLALAHIYPAVFSVFFWLGSHMYLMWIISGGDPEFSAMSESSFRVIILLKLLILKFEINFNN